jgi:hypothetical protein
LPFPGFEVIIPHSSPSTVTLVPTILSPQQS